MAAQYMYIYICLMAVFLCVEVHDPGNTAPVKLTLVEYPLDYVFTQQVLQHELIIISPAQHAYTF